MYSLKQYRIPASYLHVSGTYDSRTRILTFTLTRTLNLEITTLKDDAVPQKRHEKVAGACNCILQHLGN